MKPKILKSYFKALFIVYVSLLNLILMLKKMNISKAQSFVYGEFIWFIKNKYKYNLKINDTYTINKALK